LVSLETIEVIHTIDYVALFEMAEPHEVRFRRLCPFPYITDIFETYLDGHQISARSISLFDLRQLRHQKHQFYIEGRPAAVLWQWSGFTGDPRYMALSVDQRLVAKYGKTNALAKRGYLEPAEKDAPVALTKIRAVKELRASNSVEEIGSEEFPLDNRAGSDTLSVEHEVTKTITTTLSTESGVQYQAKLGAKFLSVVESQISAQLSEKYGHAVGESITRRQRLQFAVKPGERVRYVVRWRTTVRRGEYQVHVDAERIDVQFEARFGLSFEVASLPWAVT